MKLEDFKTGMYIRTLFGNIYKIQDEEFEIKQSTFTGHILYKKNKDYETIIKASHNIIDLIEVGDIITFKNSSDVYKVGSIPNDTRDGFYLEYDINYPEYEDIYVEKEEMENTLESIMTKEVFESMSYKL